MTENEKLYCRLRKCNNLFLHQGKKLGQKRLLRLLYRRPGITAKDLRAHFDIKPSSLSELIKKLEVSSYIRREVDKEDHRLIHLYLTQSGLSVVKEDLKKHQDSLNHIFSDFSKEEKEAFLTSLEKLISKLEG